jgi:methyl-accepting chemotaxis protein
MITTAPGTLLLAVILTASVIPCAVLAEPAAAPRSPPDAAPELTAQDRDALAVAEALAAEAGQAIEQWIVTQAVTEDRLFARFYYPIARTDPQKYSTAYDRLAERDFVIPEDRALGHSAAFHYAIVTDVNGYVPAHNSRFSQPLTGNVVQDYANNRNKRLLGDAAGLAAARSEAHYLLQRTRLDGGGIVYDLSVPIAVRGKHWGCVRVGYRRAE